MSKCVHIGEARIPFDEYVTQGTAILGIRGAGKTYTAKGIAEQLLDAKVPIIVFDAIGVWRFLKVAADNNGKAYKVVVAGGQQPDLPLTPHSAAQIIRAAIRENIPLVVDLYDTKLSKADWRKIVQESFRILLYENQGLRHIFLEEAAEYVPQKINDNHVYAEVEKLVRMGGNRSLGITMVNQRSQELNKAVLELCDNLVMMRQKGFNAIAYAEKWAERLSPAQAKDIGNLLPNFGAGDCVVFTDSHDEPVITRSDPIHSFHPDRKRPEHPKNSTVADPTEFVQRLAAELPKIIEEAKSKDPVELQKQISKLKTELEQVRRGVPQVKSEPVEVPVFDDIDRVLLDNAIKSCEEIVEKLNSHGFEVGKFAAEMRSLRGEIGVVIRNADNDALRRSKPALMRQVKQILSHGRATQPKQQASPNGIHISSTQQRILDAIAWFESIGEPEPSTLKVGCMALIDASGGHFSNTVGPLSSAGLVERGNGVIKLTDVGREYAKIPERISTLGDYHEMIRERVRKSRTASGKTVEILDAIILRGGADVSVVEIGEEVGIDHTGGHFSNTIGPLGTIGLIERRSGIVSPTAVLFPPGIT